MEGRTGVMVSIVRCDSGFATSTVPLQDVAGKIKTFPREWIDVENQWVTPEAIEYMLPLIQGEVKVPFEKGLPKYIRFI
jgi:6-phosphofructokinase 1